MGEQALAPPSESHMPLFLSDHERQAILASHDEGLLDHRWNLAQRCARRAAHPGLHGPDDDAEWWHCAFDAVSDAAMCWALKQDPAIGGWLRGTVLDLARRSVEDWVGPWFRGHGQDPPCGNLETAHLAWAVATALDLAAEVFTPAEQDELRTVLRDRAMPLCLRWLDTHPRLFNWRCILTAGYVLPAAVLDDEAALDRSADLFALAQECLQEDGSSSESLQYGHYAMTGLMLSAEALIRRRPQLAATLPLERCTRAARWFAASLLYRKPLSGWGQHPLPRSANFGDSGAIFAPSAAVVLHLAVRMRERMPAEAGLARWLADTCGPAVPDNGLGDHGSFGFVPRPGFLALPLLAQAPPAIAPAAAGIAGLEAFSNGDVILRQGRTILAVHGGGDGLNGPAHQHGDLGSCILVHRDERLLADPGHSCYRGLVHSLETQSQCHSTLTFDAGDGLMQQRSAGPRRIIDGRPATPVERGASRLLAAAVADVQATASECAGAYGGPLRRVERTWIQCGVHVVFVVDRITADVPVRTTWNWVLNDRDHGLDLKLLPPDRLVARRGGAGMKLFHAAGGHGPGLTHGWIHDAYHPKPGRRGEGANGTAAIVRWSDAQPRASLTAVHAIALDGYGPIAGWHLRPADGATVLEGPQGRERWSLRVAADGFAIAEEVADRRFRISPTWTLEHLP